MSDFSLGISGGDASETVKLASTVSTLLPTTRTPITTEESHSEVDAASETSTLSPVISSSSSMTSHLAIETTNAFASTEATKLTTLQPAQMSMDSKGFVEHVVAVNAQTTTLQPNKTEDDVKISIGMTTIATARGRALNLTNSENAKNTPVTLKSKAMSDLSDVTMDDEESDHEQLMTSQTKNKDCDTPVSTQIKQFVCIVVIFSFRNLKLK